MVMLEGILSSINKCALYIQLKLFPHSNLVDILYVAYISDITPLYSELRICGC